MKIAIALFGRRVSPRFDCASQFRIVDVENGEVVGSEIISMDSSVLNRAAKLHELGVRGVICGGLDRFSARQLGRYGIKAYAWISGEADDALAGFLAGKLESGYMMAAGGHCCGRWRFGQCRGRHEGRKRPLPDKNQLDDKHQ